MKRIFLCSVSAILLLLAHAAKASAQSCVSFTPDFSSYVTESTDGTHIYTSVTLEGSGNMTITTLGLLAVRRPAQTSSTPRTQRIS